MHEQLTQMLEVMWRALLSNLMNIALWWLWDFMHEQLTQSFRVFFVTCKEKFTLWWLWDKSGIYACVAHTKIEGLKSIHCHIHRKLCMHKYTYTLSLGVKQHEKDIESQWNQFQITKYSDLKTSFLLEAGIGEITIRIQKFDVEKKLKWMHCVDLNGWEVHLHWWPPSPLPNSVNGSWV